MSDPIAVVDLSGAATRAQLATLRLLVSWVRIRSGGDISEMIGMLVGALCAVAAETADAEGVLAVAIETLGDARPMVRSASVSGVPTEIL